MKKRLIACLLMALPCIGGIAHVWDELAILVRRNSDGTFTLEKESYLPISTYTNAVFFDFNNDGNLDLLIMGQGGDWNVSGDVRLWPCIGTWEKRMIIVLRKLPIRDSSHTKMKVFTIDLRRRL